MIIFHYIGLFIGGGTLVNAIPHLVNGVSGRPFQTPFAEPPGKGLSSSTLNVLWGFMNLLSAYLLLIRWSSLQLNSAPEALTAGLGALMTALFCARHFGKLHGGTAPQSP